MSSCRCKNKGPVKEDRKLPVCSAAWLKFAFAASFWDQPDQQTCSGLRLVAQGKGAMVTYLLKHGEWKAGRAGLQLPTVQLTPEGEGLPGMALPTILTGAVAGQRSIGASSIGASCIGASCIRASCIGASKSPNQQLKLMA